MSIELIPLATMRVEVRFPLVVGNGRMIYEVESGTIDGARLKGKLKGSSGADWMVMDDNGVGTVDVRLLIETEDDALIYMQYMGRVDTNAPGLPILTAPRFETGDDRYRWLNAVQAVGKGSLDGATLVYELYELR